MVEELAGRRKGLHAFKVGLLRRTNCPRVHSALTHCKPTLRWLHSHVFWCVLLDWCAGQRRIRHVRQLNIWPSHLFRRSCRMPMTNVSSRRDPSCSAVPRDILTVEYGSVHAEISFEARLRCVRIASAGRMARRTLGDNGSMMMMSYPSVGAVFLRCYAHTCPRCGCGTSLLVVKYYYCRPTSILVVSIACSCYMMSPSMVAT